MNLIGNGNAVAQLVHDLACQFEAQIHAPRADVEQNVSGCRGGDVLSAADLAKRMQLGRTRIAE